MVSFAVLLQATCLLNLISITTIFGQPYGQTYAFESSFTLEEERLPFGIGCAYGSISVGTKCIKVFKTPLPWKHADLSCRSRHMRLLEIRLGDDYYELRKTLVQYNLGYNSYWVGIRNYQNDQYVYVSDYNSSIPGAFWGPYFSDRDIVREPRRPEFNEKRCAFLNGKLYHFHSTDTCINPKGFICEATHIQEVAYGGTLNQDPIAVELSYSPPVVQEICQTPFISVDGYEGCYLISDSGNELNYYDANQKCQSLGGHLFKLRNMLQSEFLSELLDKSSIFGKLELFWIDRSIPSKRSVFVNQDAGTCTSVWIQPLHISQMNNQINTAQTSCSLELRYICSKNN